MNFASEPVAVIHQRDDANAISHSYSAIGPFEAVEHFDFSLFLLALVGQTFIRLVDHIVDVHVITFANICRGLADNLTVFNDLLPLGDFAYG